MRRRSMTWVLSYFRNLLSEFDFSTVLSSFWNELLVPLLSLS